MSELYQGKVVPELIMKQGEMDCNNSFCMEIRCEDCINFPTISASLIKHDYLFDKEYNVNIHKGA